MSWRKGLMWLITMSVCAVIGTILGWYVTILVQWVLETW